MLQRAQSHLTRDKTMTHSPHVAQLEHVIVTRVILNWSLASFIALGRGRHGKGEGCFIGLNSWEVLSLRIHKRFSSLEGCFTCIVTEVKLEA